MSQPVSRLRPLRSVFWTRIPSPGSEYFALWSDGEGRQLRGTAVAVLAGRPVNVRYGVLCDREWRTLSAHAALRSGGPEHALHLESEGGRWRVNGVLTPELDGAVDVDLGITPATNLLPIRRLRLDLGQTARVLAAWVRFPDLEVRPLEQTYERLEERRYQYRSASFSAVIDVDDMGLPVTYEGGWTREAALDL